MQLTLTSHIRAIKALCAQRTKLHCTYPPPAITIPLPLYGDIQVGTSVKSPKF